jgi:hypothetical protein
MLPTHAYGTICPVSANILNALTLGSLVVSTAANANAEFIEDGVNGRLLRNVLAEDIAMITSLLRDRSLRARMIAAAQGRWHAKTVRNVCAMRWPHEEHAVRRPVAQRVDNPQRVLASALFAKFHLGRLPGAEGLATGGLPDDRSYLFATATLRIDRLTAIFCSFWFSWCQARRSTTCASQ